MKLFKSLLVAPATLGLLAPMTATANELNLNDVLATLLQKKFRTSANSILLKNLQLLTAVLMD